MPIDVTAQGGMPAIPPDTNLADYQAANGGPRRPLPASTPADYPAPSAEAVGRGADVAQAVWDNKNPTANQATRDLAQGQARAQDQSQVIAQQGQSTQGDGTKQQAPPITPYDVVLKDHNPETLEQAAIAAGINVTKLPQGYFENMSQHYDNIEKPSTLQAVRAWYDASGIGHFMQGFDDADRTKYGQQTAWYDALDQGGVSSPDMRAADRFFNAHIQSRIIDGSQYIDGNGNYNPPATYKAGKLLGSPSTAYGTLAAEGALTGLLGAARGTATFMMAHPAASAFLQQALKHTAMGAAMMYGMKMAGGGGAAPPPAP